VTTVVTKLLAIVQPDTAVFGAKDAQQLLVIEQLVRDLNLPVGIVRGETVREPDGLAMSSRNARLSDAARRQAAAISRSLAAAADAHRLGEAPISAAARVLEAADIAPEYLALCDAATLGPAVQGRESILLVAASVGGVRLIDNIVLNPQPEP
jgi:pantoate--beta-alanine ligase